MDIDLAELKNWARDAGEIARRHYRHTSGRRKADQSWVTEADIEVERWLVERLAARYPDHGIIGEENTRQATERELVWALDPIDGTASFVAGLPIWGVSIGLIRAGQPWLGVFYMPIVDELYWCDQEGRAYFNGDQIAVVGAREWEGEDWITVPSNSHRRFAIDFIGKTRSLGSSVADLCFVARGASLGALLTRCAIWDLAAGIAILQAAGGVYTGLSGHAPDLAAMTLTGDPLPEPLIAAGPAHIEPLRRRISSR